MLKQFASASEKVVAHAKADLSASVQALVEKLGFEKLEDLRAAIGERAVPALKEKT